MATSKTVTYGDNPIQTMSQDWLSRGSACDALLSILQTANLDMPLAIGIYGAWGSGKTSLMRMLVNKLEQDSVYIWFNAWEYAQQREALWRAFLLQFVTQFQKDDVLARLVAGRKHASEPTSAQIDQEQAALRENLDRMIVSLYRTHTFHDTEGYKVNWQSAAWLGARSIVRMLAPVVGEEGLKAIQKQFAEGKDVENMLQLFEKKQSEDYRQHMTSLEQFRMALHALIQQYINETGRRLFVFVDDLDRCLPEDALSVLESIKVFFEPPSGDALNCVFILGMDRAIIEQGIRLRYESAGPPAAPAVAINARQYLDKIIQLPFTIPPLNTSQMTQFIKRWAQDYGKPELASCANLIATGIAPNPRSVKRILNVLCLMLALRKVEAETIGSSLGLLAKIVVLQTSYDHLYAEIVGNPALLKDMEVAAARPGKDAGVDAKIQPYPQVVEMMRLEPFFPNDLESLNKLIFFTRVSE